MSSNIKMLNKRGLISPPNWLVDNVVYEVQMGSVAYGVSNDHSDIDIYGYCVPRKNIIFPHNDGVIYGFDKDYEKFEQFQQHHVINKDSRKEYDISIYNIVKYFSLCCENNPNMIDSLFVPRRCVLHSTMVGEMVRENRKMFLHKGSFHKFKGYAFSQLSKMNNKRINEFIKMCDFYGLSYDVPIDVAIEKASQKDMVTTEMLTSFKSLIKEVDKNGNRTKRIESIVIHKYDVKFAYHIVRLALECEQILVEGDLDLERHKEQLKSIRRGEWDKEQITEFFENKEKDLEKLYIESKAVPHKPDREKIKTLLLNCLEEHYGDLSFLVRKNDSVYIDALKQIDNILHEVVHN